jgi:2-polyprenyl-3-methyl-5-hydroxy-6-metoxy-1,4-benzoquinol methylase
LDFGCGEADFLAAAARFERRVGIDFSKQAMKNDRCKYGSKGLTPLHGSDGLLEDFLGTMDVVTSFGTLEHLDKPFETFHKLACCLRDNGVLIVSCPSFLNARGIIWMSLVMLFNVPMSLSDKHFLTIPIF